MDKVITIYEAKTQLSKLVKQAQAGKTIYVGAYGHAQAVISPLPRKQEINIGVWDHKKKSHAYKDGDLVGPDPDIINDFEDSVNRPLT
jgi:antitoxin (DNA-binding transcriptional repressor) of toxin-antitoxin stability system